LEWETTQLVSLFVALRSERLFKILCQLTPPPPPNPEPAITLCPTVLDLDDDIHLVGMGVGAFKVGLLVVWQMKINEVCLLVNLTIANTPSNRI